MGNLKVILVRCGYRGTVRQARVKGKLAKQRAGLIKRAENKAKLRLLISRCSGLFCSKVTVR